MLKFRGPLDIMHVLKTFFFWGGGIYAQNLSGIATFGYSLFFLKYVFNSSVHNKCFAIYVCLSISNGFV